MKVSLIAAMDRNRLLGGPNGIPWHLPRDVEHFRDFTRGKFMLLGRRTFEEMQGWFSDQTPIVLTSHADYPHALSAPTVDDALALAKKSGAGELVVSGGGQVYAATLDHCDEMVLTLVDGEFVGNIHFPHYAADEWNEVSRTDYPPNDAQGSPVAMTIVVLQRRRTNTR